MRPCTGHAAPSARAQMVWPSICLVSSHSRSISSALALPSTNLHIIVFIQSQPSRQGVHCPQGHQNPSFDRHKPFWVLKV